MTKPERNELADYIKQHPESTYIEIAVETGLASSTIARIAAEFQVTRKPGPRTGRRARLVAEGLA